MFSKGRIIQFDQLNSTNNIAKELLKNNLVEEFDIISTHHQAAGRGYGNNRWESEKGKNISASFILQPDNIMPQEQFLITQFISLAISDMIQNYLKDSSIKIKWPNDIYVDDTKICGILIENTIMGNTIKNSIAGIGININQTEFSEYIPNPVSLKTITNKTYDISVIMTEMIDQINYWHEKLISNEFDFIKQQYQQRLYRLDKLHCFITHENEKFMGKIRDTDNYGRIRIEDQNNCIRIFYFKEISFVL